VKAEWVSIYHAYLPEALDIIIGKREDLYEIFIVHTSNGGVKRIKMTVRYDELITHVEKLYKFIRGEGNDVKGKEP